MEQSTTGKYPVVIRPTTITCVKVKSIRPRYNNLEEWMADPNNVYIGRNGRVFIGSGDSKRIYHYKGSVWENPYNGRAVKRDHPKWTKRQVHQELVKKYQIYIRGKLSSGEIPWSELRKLKKKTLGCWCKPLPCHGDVLVALVNRYC